MNKKFNNEVPVILIIGKSGSGKTTFIEKLIPVLEKRGYRIGAIKHTHHQFEIDYPGKDSYRIAQAGAEVVVIASSEKIAVIKKLKEEKSLYEILNWLFSDVDLVLVEGYKNNVMPRIEITSGKILDVGKTATWIERKFLTKEVKC